MQEKCRQFFANDEVLRCFVVLTTIFNLAAIVDFFANKNFYSGFTSLFAACSIVAMYIAYRRHDKNVMKGLMGAVLGIIALKMADMFFNGNKNVISALTAIAAVVLYVNHFIINSDHNSKPVNIQVNHIICALFVIFCFVQMIMEIVKGNPLMSFANVAIILSIGFIVCIESKIDAYKQIRDKAEADGSWDSEKKADLKKEIFGK